MANILSARASKRAYTPLIQRMFPVDLAIHRMLSSRRSDERVEGIKALTRSSAPKSTIAQRLRVAFFDDYMDCNIAALKTAAEGRILDPQTIASAIRLYERSAHFAFHYGGVGGCMGSTQYDREDLQRFALNVVAAADRLDPSVLRDAYAIRAYSRQFSLKELFMPLTKGTGWKLPHDFDVVASFNSEDKYLGTVNVSSREKWESVIGERYNDFADGKIFDAAILRLYAQQRGSADSRIAEAALRQILSSPRSLVHSEANGSEIERTLEMMRYVQGSISRWLSANWAFAPFLFEDTNVNMVLKLDILNYIQEQQHATRLLLAAGPIELRPFLMLHLGALSGIVDSIKVALLRTYEVKLRQGAPGWDIHDLTQMLFHYFTEQTVLIKEIRSRLMSGKGTRDIEYAYGLLTHLTYQNLSSMINEILSKLIVINDLRFFKKFFWYYLNEPYHPSAEEIVSLRETLFAALRHWNDQMSEVDRNKILSVFDEWRKKAERS